MATVAAQSQQQPHLENGVMYRRDPATFAKGYTGHIPGDGKNRQEGFAGGNTGGIVGGRGRAGGGGDNDDRDPNTFTKGYTGHIPTDEEHRRSLARKGIAVPGKPNSAPGRSSSQGGQGQQGQQGRPSSGGRRPSAGGGQRRPASRGGNQRRAISMERGHTVSTQIPVYVSDMQTQVEDGRGNAYQPQPANQQPPQQQEQQQQRPGAPGQQNVAPQDPGNQANAQKPPRAPQQLDGRIVNNHKPSTLFASDATFDDVGRSQGAAAKARSRENVDPKDVDAKYRRGPPLAGYTGHIPGQSMK